MEAQMCEVETCILWMKFVPDRLEGLGVGMTLSKTFMTFVACGLMSGTIWGSNRAETIKVTLLGTGTPGPLHINLRFADDPGIETCSSDKYVDVASGFDGHTS
jgi:hypothetical protein